MVTSLYICEIPRNIDKENIHGLFCSFEGYRETRIKITSNKDKKIAFVDFDSESDARFAMDQRQGYKFYPTDRGILINFADKNKQGSSQSVDEAALGRKRFRSRDEDRRRSRPRDRSPDRRDPEAEALELLAKMTESKEESAGIDLVTLAKNFEIVEMLNNLNNPDQNKSSSKIDKELSYFSDSLASSFDEPHNSTPIVYVEGIPADCSERELAHIFRPFPGFKGARIVKNSKAQGTQSHIGFADFESSKLATLCINTLQGYRFDKKDVVGLYFGYGVSRHKGRR